MSCIFCSSEGTYQSVAHIVPESLGGKTSPIGKPGVTCDACNQYFGQKVESKALQSFPFSGFRVLTGVPSKKGTMPKIQTTAGVVHATGNSGVVQLEPRSDELRRLINSGKVNQLRIIAEVTEPLAVCRTLLKIGLEQLGKHFYEVATSERVRAARDFARRPARSEHWWFIIQANPVKYVSGAHQYTNSSIEIIEREGVLISVLHLLGVSTMIPLEQGTLPPEPRELPEPEYRIIIAKC
ncbi:HNH endonuclease [Methylomonas methanica]|uniref:HNH endonuclease 5 domain-containing protein n=1 Tax=Methylomonas methanica (strain DSM 25384 / MC09) TaxID=857087 RepID=G0A7I9_METMM|nr:HNH endonuclease [Methylomonas methanica]AEG00659.1 hypothetical protein Metme_2255 [Methylomonas methanica MC09]